ncbi:DUF937 domain-containing protein [Chryseobacterium sp. CCH4-E10]|uniref:DUF937 domain-containing protein n=1 Tax=Chryseobacterium sp. CCH4-E10 TaxID=1768758 RepID=UPI00082F2143|nr:DUF937 domain-containing protein [Chryseobacterium sp. CCH4-E10]
MSLMDLLTGNTGSQVAERAENKFGINRNQVLALLAVAAPLIISYLSKKSQSANEAESLNTALDKDHDGSILNDVTQAEARQSEGNSILNHIFGGEKQTVENQLSQKTGISIDKIGPVLAMLAPIIMGYIGKEKQQSNVGAGGLGGLLESILGNASSQTKKEQSNPLNDIIGSVLGNDNKKKGDEDGGLGSILGNIFGGK